ncbi:MAG: beta-lactamase family protein [Flavobacteriaceae bacterium]|jgi:CubicO group peptidase (beta-lactamase class C family)|nr:beta-lactamase family protein [Flavobacteriaceae bacterium]
MRKFSRIFLSAFLFFLISCKKNKNNIAETKKEEINFIIPNFGNVDLKTVFSKQDRYLKNEDSIKNFLGNYYKTIWESGNLSGGIIVAKGDNILLEKYRGFAQENSSEPIDENTPLHIASISKTLTAMAILKLAETKKLKLSDPITKFFPKFPYPNIQIKHLLNQRSGLPKYEHFIEKIEPKPAELSQKFLTNQDILNLLIKYKPEPARSPDTGFMYCNTNFAMLALIVEKITKMPFPEAMQKMIFEPLNMKNTYIFQEKDTLKAAKSFFNRGNKLFPFDRLDLIYGDKNVYTTPKDMLNFSTALFAENFLGKDLKQQIFTPYSNEKPGINNYGLGCRLKIFDDGEKLVYHTGWWHGSNAVFAHLLKSKVTIIAIGNKYSRRIYSALSLSSLFENFPYEIDLLRKEMKPQNGTKIDSTNISEE